METDKTNYKNYLKSEHWQWIKKKKRDKRCFVCGIKKNLNLHHRSYVRLGNEDLKKDLVWVCQKHHYLLHEIVKTTKTELYNAVDVLKRKLKPKKWELDKIIVDGYILNRWEKERFKVRSKFFGKKLIPSKGKDYSSHKPKFLIQYP